MQPEFRPSRYVIGENIKRFRIEKGWSYSKLALEVKLNTTLIQEYESGLRNLSANKLDDFARVLGIKPLDLLEDWNEEE